MSFTCGVCFGDPCVCHTSKKIRRAVKDAYWKDWREERDRKHKEKENFMLPFITVCSTDVISYSSDLPSPLVIGHYASHDDIVGVGDGLDVSGDVEGIISHQDQANVAKLPCCGHTNTTLVCWDIINKDVRCRNCGHIYEPKKA